jgi:hypothetical protein
MFALSMKQIVLPRVAAIHFPFTVVVTRRRTVIDSILAVR